MFEKEEYVSPESESIIVVFEKVLLQQTSDNSGGNEEPEDFDL